MSTKVMHGSFNARNMGKHKCFFFQAKNTHAKYVIVYEFYMFFPCHDEIRNVPHSQTPSPVCYKLLIKLLLVEILFADTNYVTQEQIKLRNKIQIFFALNIKYVTICIVQELHFSAIFLP